MKQTNKTPDYLKIAETLKSDMVAHSADAALKFFVESFENQGFTDENFEAWKPSKGTILIKSGDLRDSIKVIEATEEKIVFQSDEEYSQIHNEGGTIPITKESRAFFWYMYKKSKKSKWKAMALTKKKVINIPKRQFIGESKTLMKELDQWIANEIEERNKNSKK